MPRAAWGIVCCALAAGGGCDTLFPPARPAGERCAPIRHSRRHACRRIDPARTAFRRSLPRPWSLEGDARHLVAGNARTPGAKRSPVRRPQRQLAHRIPGDRRNQGRRGRPGPSHHLQPPQGRRHSHGRSVAILQIRPARGPGGKAGGGFIEGCEVRNHGRSASIERRTREDSLRTPDPARRPRGALLGPAKTARNS